MVPASFIRKPRTRANLADQRQEICRLRTILICFGSRGSPVRIGPPRPVKIKFLGGISFPQSVPPGSNQEAVAVAVAYRWSYTRAVRATGGHLNRAARLELAGLVAFTNQQLRRVGVCDTEVN
jgi:hypothetical protein